MENVARNSVFVILIISSLLSGCNTVNHGEFSVLSILPIDHNKNYQKVEEAAVGTDKEIYWALYAGQPQLDAAVRDALQKYNGDYMTNVKVTFRSWMIPVIYGEFKLEVKGEVWKALPNSPPRN